jgi:small subunit ribosomal protein S16
MAVKLRLARRGAVHRPYYRIVAADSRAPRDGRNIEEFGRFDPLGEQKITVDAERAKYWISQGAEVSSRVAELFKRAGVLAAAEAK